MYQQDKSEKDRRGFVDDAGYVPASRLSVPASRLSNERLDSVRTSRKFTPNFPF